MLKRVINCEWRLGTKTIRSIYVWLFVVCSTYGPSLLRGFAMTLQGRKLRVALLVCLPVSRIVWTDTMQVMLGVFQKLVNCTSPRSGECSFAANGSYDKPWCCRRFYRTEINQSKTHLHRFAKVSKSMENYQKLGWNWGGLIRCMLIGKPRKPLT